MNADGSNQTRLTVGTTDNFASAFNPDGNKIAFCSKRDGHPEIYCMNADGTNQTRLTTTGGTVSNYTPSFSPDGSSIVFASDRDGAQEIYSMQADGSAQTRLTFVGGQNFGPSFSPDGKRIVFASNHSGADEIYQMNHDGSNLVALTVQPMTARKPSFSPDGSHIVFDAESAQQIYVMHTDGSSPVPLTNTSINSWPSWGGSSSVPTISGVTPPIGVVGSSITLTGQNFVNVQSVAFNGLPTNYTVDAPTQITAVVPNGATTGSIAVTTFAGTAVSPAPFTVASGKPGKIVFTSRPNYDQEIYVINPDGTGRTRLTNNPAYDYQPAFTPDGSKIIFTSNRAGLEQLFLMNVDGSNLQQLTNDSCSNSNPAYSPDGSKIAFTSTRNGDTQIYVMNADGSNQTCLTSSASYMTINTGPAFSPDGKKIIFVSMRDGNFQIYIMNADGTNQTRLTNNTAWEVAPTFSPDGKTIAFSSDRSGHSEIWSMNADGSNQQPLTATSGTSSKPSFSPDGSKIVFTSDRDGSSMLYIMDADGRNTVRLTTSTTYDSAPSWGNAPTLIPTAQDDAYLIRKNQSFILPAPGVLGNDTNPGGGLLHAIKVSDPQHGVLMLNADGSFTYSPTPGYVGPDAFTYQASDGTYLSNVATVTLTVRMDSILQVATPMVCAGSDFAQVPIILTAQGDENMLRFSLNFDPAVLCSTRVDLGADAGDASLLVESAADGQIGLSIALPAGQTFPAGTYMVAVVTFWVPTPDPPNSVPLTFGDAPILREVADAMAQPVGALWQDGAVTFNHAPVAQDDAYSVNENTRLTVAAPGVLGNDTDEDGDTLTAALVYGTGNGTLNLHADGSFNYTPNHNFIGIDSFTYQASDGTTLPSIASVTLTVLPTGFEADVAPRDGGDGRVSIADMVQVGRFAAGLDTPSSPSEYQRADCAPISTRGDGQLTVADWVQAGRYAVGLDPLTPAGGPTTGAVSSRAQATGKTPCLRTVHLAPTTLTRGKAAVVRVVLDAQGNESALGFTLHFNPTQVKFVGVKLTGAAHGATLNVNTKAANNGSVGVAMMLPLPKTVNAGKQTLVEFTFQPLAYGIAPITFTDQVISREIAGAAANTLPTTFVNGTVVVRK